MIIVYIMCVWFLILLFNKDYFLCAIVVLLASIANIVIVDVYQLTETMSYMGEQRVLISLDGIPAMILAYLYNKDKLAFKMSLLLAFSILCHTMIVWDLTTPYSSFVSNLFYTWYDELIITIGILQMVISRDGIPSALRNIRGNILRNSFFSWCYSKSLLARKRSEPSQ